MLSAAVNGGPNRRPGRSRTFALAGVVAASGTLSVALAAQQRGDDDAAFQVGSYAFDVTDPQQLLSRADAAFIGEVVAKEATDEGDSTTVWRVAPSTTVKGDPHGEVLVRQLGYVDADGRTHATEDQPLLVAGRRYLLVTTVDKGTGTHTLLAGPAASVPAGSADREAELLATYRAALGRG